MEGTEGGAVARSSGGQGGGAVWEILRNFRK